jgi:hypothetical protein
MNVLLALANACPKMSVVADMMREEIAAFKQKQIICSQSHSP